MKSSSIMVPPRIISRKTIISIQFVLVLVSFQGPTTEATRSYNLSDYYKENNESVFAKFSILKEEYQPVDLGEGFPDFLPSKILRSALADVAHSEDYSLSQYPPNYGHPRLLNAISRLYSKLLEYYLDPKENIVITVGGTEALFITFQAYTNSGDEWIVFEPYYEPYEAIIRAARGIMKFVPLKSKRSEGVSSTADWTFDRVELANAFSNKTRGILVNSPNNPIGKMFNHEELSCIADLAKKWDTLVIFDAVYEFLAYDDNSHIRMSTLPGMYERTITIGSAGKVFAATGYRIGYAYGPSKLIKNLKTIHSIVVKSAPTPIQEAVAVAFEKEFENYGKFFSYLETFRRESEAKRNYFVKLLENVGIDPIIPQGGFFIVADGTKLFNKSIQNDETILDENDSFAEWLTKNFGVLGLPLTGFLSKQYKSFGKNIMRLTLVKNDQTISQVEEALMKLKSDLANSG